MHVPLISAGHADIISVSVPPHVVTVPFEGTKGRQQTADSRQCTVRTSTVTAASRQQTAKTRRLFAT